MRSARILAAAAVLHVALVAPAAPTRAAELYLSGGLAISGGSAQAGGSIDGGGITIPISGEDRDSSSAWGGAFGLAVAADEALDEVWGLELPSWLVRFELDGFGGRDWELRSQGANPFFSEVSAWSLMTNVWLDVPLRTTVGWLLGRVPVLDPLSLYGGGGIGVASLDVETTDNVSTGTDSGARFAWQAGIGLGYALTPWTTLSVGYRYHSLGSAETPLSLGPGAGFGSHELDLAAHELVTAVRVGFYAAPLEDFSPRRWALPRPRLPDWLVPGR